MMDEGFLFFFQLQNLKAHLQDLQIVLKSLL